MPHIEVSVKFPGFSICKETTELILSKVNEMNLDNPGCSTCFDLLSERMSIRSLINFSEYFIDSDDPYGHFARIRVAITINTFAEVISCAMNWRNQISEFYIKIRQLQN